MKKNILAIMVCLPLTLTTYSVIAADTVLDQFYTPAEAGIIWVSVEPMFLDSNSYKADFKVTCNRVTKRFTYKKQSRYPVTIGIPHWKNNATKVKVSRPEYLFSDNFTEIVTLRHGRDPEHSYQSTAYIDDFSCK
ncbi:hypothetical protein [Pseudoalteromonas sp. L1]|uniref:hypothetical protein n=1 Tax=Pseudoalteromonas sp. L1 TaxID=195716 RepID=UPI001F2E2A33|nr:hypothetical protein [Pseudoalteromonas sp. L1]